MANDNQAQATPTQPPTQATQAPPTTDSFWDRVEGKTTAPVAGSTQPQVQPADPTGQHSFRAGTVPPTPQSTPQPTPQPQSQPGVSHGFWDIVEGKSKSGPGSTQDTKPQGDIIDRAVAGTSLEPINRGIEQGVAAGFGLKAPDPNHPESITFTDMANQTWNNLKRSAERSYETLGGASDEELNNVPTYRLDVPLRSAAAILATPFDMAATGIDGMASMLHEGGKEFISGIKSSDHQTAARGFGKMLSSAAQIAAGAEAPEAVEGAGKLTEFSPREVQGTKLTGAPRPANLMQGPINRSVGALARDVRFGDPSKALIEEGITWPGSKGRLVQVNGKLAQLGSQLRSTLQNAKGAIDIDKVLDPIIKKYKDKIRLSAVSDDIKAQAYQDLDVLRKTAAEHAPSGQATAAEANSIKQAIGDAVNWEKRPSNMPMHDHTINAYREAYGQLKDSVNGMVGKDGAELSRRVSNLMAAKNSLKELTTQEKAGRGPTVELTKPTAALQSAAGHVAPAGIVGSQKVAAAAVPATRVATAAAGNVSQDENREHWVRVRTSDGKLYDVHPEDVVELHKRDPKMEVIKKQGLTGTRE